MNAIATPVLTPPAPFFGAVKGERKLTRRWFLWTAFAVLLVVLAATSRPQLEVFHIPIRDSDSGMYPTMWVFVVLWLFGWGAYTEDVLDAHEKKFRDDIKHLKSEYFMNDVFPYLARKYGAEMSDRDAAVLYDGWACRVQVQGEWKKVRLTGKASVKEFAMGRVSRFYPEDLIFEEVIDPAVTQYVPLKPVV